jgi:hypothetical protein
MSLGKMTCFTSLRRDEQKDGENSSFCRELTSCAIHGVYPELLTNLPASTK